MEKDAWRICTRIERKYYDLTHEEFASIEELVDNLSDREKDTIISKIRNEVKQLAEKISCLSVVPIDTEDIIDELYPYLKTQHLSDVKDDAERIKQKWFQIDKDFECNMIKKMPIERAVKIYERENEEWLNLVKQFKEKYKLK